MPLAMLHLREQIKPKLEAIIRKAKHEAITDQIKISRGSSPIEKAESTNSIINKN